MWLAAVAATCRCQVRALRCVAVLAALCRWHRRTAREAARAAACLCRRALRLVAAAAHCLCRAVLRLAATADPYRCPSVLAQRELAATSCSLAARHHLARAALSRWLVVAAARAAVTCRYWAAPVLLRLAVPLLCRVVLLNCRLLMLLPPAMLTLVAAR